MKGLGCSALLHPELNKEVRIGTVTVRSSLSGSVVP